MFGSLSNYWMDQLSWSVQCVVIGVAGHIPVTSFSCRRFLSGWMFLRLTLFFHPLPRRSGRRIRKTRKYDIITTPAERVEMAPLNEENDEDDDSTLFDVKYRQVLWLTVNLVKATLDVCHAQRQTKQQSFYCTAHTVSAPLMWLALYSKRKFFLLLFLSQRNLFFCRCHVVMRFHPSAFSIVFCHNHFLDGRRVLFTWHSHVPSQASSNTSLTGCRLSRQIKSN